MCTAYVGADFDPYNKQTHMLMMGTISPNGKNVQSPVGVITIARDRVMICMLREGRLQLATKVGSTVVRAFRTIHSRQSGRHGADFTPTAMLLLPPVTAVVVLVFYYSQIVTQYNQMSSNLAQDEDLRFDEIT